MLNGNTMLFKNTNKVVSGIFLTFSGNCKEALTFYHSCFGGTLHFDTFTNQLQDFPKNPVIFGSLISKDIVIHGSDLVADEGRIIGNYLSVFLMCENVVYRNLLVEKLASSHYHFPKRHHDLQKLIEISDAYDVKWLLAISSVM
ncbi:VOC family protein [Sphingobacterium faecium]